MVLCFTVLLIIIPIFFPLVLQLVLIFAWKHVVDSSAVFQTWFGPLAIKPQPPYFLGLAY